MLWLKAVHIIGIISWMAALLYLYRLFVYHNEESVAVVKERLSEMEQKLFWRIATPAFLISLISGVMMVLQQPQYYMKAGWFHTKLLSVVILIFLHFFSLSIRKKLLLTPHPFKDGKLRLLNELPTLLMIVIVVMVVVKPF